MTGRAGCVRRGHRGTRRRRRGEDARKAQFMHVARCTESVFSPAVLVKGKGPVMTRHLGVVAAFAVCSLAGFACSQASSTGSHSGGAGGSDQAGGGQSRSEEHTSELH